MRNRRILGWKSKVYKNKKSGSHEWDFSNFMNRICIEKCNYNNELLLFVLQMSI